MDYTAEELIFAAVIEEKRRQKQAQKGKVTKTNPSSRHRSKGHLTICTNGDRQNDNRTGFVVILATSWVSLQVFHGYLPTLNQR